MKKIVVHAGFHPEVVREYKGEYIYKVIKNREINGLPYFLLEHGIWVKGLGDDKYTTDYTAEERWGRVESIDESGKSADLGFMLLRVDRSKGVL